MEIIIPMIDPIDREGREVLSRKIHSEFNNLSNGAKTFITDNLEVFDNLEGVNKIFCLDYVLDRFKEVIKDRFYSNDSDEDDYQIADNMKFLIQLFEIYIE